MGGDLLNQAVVSGGAAAVLGVLCLIVGPKIFKSTLSQVLAQHSKDYKGMSGELKKVRRVTHKTNILMSIVLWHLSKDTDDPKIKAAVKSHLLDQDDDDDEEDEEEKKG